MNRAEYEQHQEQMQAKRKEFAEVWARHIAQMQTATSTRQLAMMELKAWNKWRVGRGGPLVLHRWPGSGFNGQEGQQ